MGSLLFDVPSHSLSCIFVFPDLARHFLDLWTIFVAKEEYSGRGSLAQSTQEVSLWFHWFLFAFLLVCSGFCYLLSISFSEAILGPFKSSKLWCPFNFFCAFPFGLPCCLLSVVFFRLQFQWFLLVCIVVFVLWLFLF